MNYFLYFGKKKRDDFSLVVCDVWTLLHLHIRTDPDQRLVRSSVVDVNVALLFFCRIRVLAAAPASSSEDQRLEASVHEHNWFYRTYLKDVIL